MATARTTININGRTTLLFKTEEFTIGTIISPFMSRLQYMSYSALMHLLLTARSMMREVNEKEANKKFLENMIDHFRELPTQSLPKRTTLKMRMIAESNARVQLMKALCNLVLSSEGLGRLPEELRNNSGLASREESLIVGFNPKRAGGF